ncbi:hypothetical protein C2E20_0403 [Micractinium conductrix]|uniref:Uncharacterized protein n=1 Tax=Micractinium conductrix TaxID=554055 RepID=A0A2P6VPW0_9CHLO|nr:hypothetical protein C2E20_0403 [Micractinium conductrix]|eukprot:PSC76097.1 hypothetical protein C2E20_0403 [Micractinium conductrix]
MVSTSEKLAPEAGIRQPAAALAVPPACSKDAVDVDSFLQEHQLHEMAAWYWHVAARTAIGLVTGTLWNNAPSEFALAKRMLFFSSAGVACGGAGKLRPNFDNTFQMTVTCKISGSGASTAANRWRAQLIFCGTGETSCSDAVFPKFATVTKKCGGQAALTGGDSSCILDPAESVDFSPSVGGKPSVYSADFTTVISNAWKAKATTYYVKCFYLCEGDKDDAQERAASSFIIDAPLPAPPPPRRPPPPSPRPPPPSPLPTASFYGTATAFINSPLKDPSNGAIFSPPTNVVPVTAVCRVAGKYAKVSSNNWPAQLLICGDPPGSDSCEDTSYDPTVPIIKPVKIEVVDGEYIATYQFDVTNAIVGGQLITYRYFTCLYSDATGSTTKRAGASVDVYTARPPPPSPKPPSPPPPSPAPPNPTPPPPRFSRTVAPPGQRAHGWGDPHFTGFNGTEFIHYGRIDAWNDILSGAGSSSLKFKAMFKASRLSGRTFMRGFELKSMGDTLRVLLVPDPSGSPADNTIKVEVNGKRIAGPVKPAETLKFNVRSGYSVHFTPARVGKLGAVKATIGGLVEVVMIQKYRPRRAHHADFLDFNMVLNSLLPAPVTGVLAESYNIAFRNTRASQISLQAEQGGADVASADAPARFRFVASCNGA